MAWIAGAAPAQEVTAQEVTAQELRETPSADALGERATEPAPEAVAHLFGLSGSFVSVYLEEGELLSRWNLSEIAGLDRLLPESPRGGLGQWSIYDPIYDAKRNRLLFVAPTGITAFEETGHQLLALYPPRFGLAARLDLGKPLGDPPRPARLVHHPASDSLALLRPAADSKRADPGQGAGPGVRVSILDASSLRVEREIVLEGASAGAIHGVVAHLGTKLVLGSELFDLGAAGTANRARAKSAPIDLMASLDEAARQNLGKALNAKSRLPDQFASPFLHGIAGSTALARIPRSRIEGGVPVPVGGSLLVVSELVDGTAGRVIELDHLAESLVLSNDGRLAATLAHKAGALSVLDLGTGEERHRVEDAKLEDPLGRVLCVGADGATVVAATDSLIVWTPGNEPRTVLRGVHPAGWIGCAFGAR